jgi:hypothetical protein
MTQRGVAPQRLETILMFLGQGRFRRERFQTRLDLGDGLAHPFEH